MNNLLRFLRRFWYPMKVLVMPLVLICLLAEVAMARPVLAQDVLGRKITLLVEGQTIKETLHQIAKQANIRFVYSQQVVGAERKITLRAEEQPLAAVLDEVLSPLKIQYEVTNDRVVLRAPVAIGSSSAIDSGSSTTNELAANVPITGRVLDAKGSGIPGVTVVVKGSTQGTSTDSDGRFSLQVPENSTLVFSFVGYTRQEVPVTGANSNLAVTLSESAQELNDVVVIGYGTARKSDLTGAVASVSSAQLTQVATSDPVQALQGRVSGVEVTSNSGQPGSGTRIRVRGVGTINNSDPLYVVDGVQTGDISFLLPTDIESTEILKDASATAIYGSRGANGVVLITTKHGRAGQTQFNLTGYTGFQEIRRKLPLTNAAQYATLVSEAYTNAGAAIPTNFAAGLQDAISTNATGPNFQDLVTQKGLVQNYSISAAGGTEQNRFLVSGSYFQQNGIILNSGFRKYVLRLNDDIALTKRIKGGVSATFSNSNTTGQGDGSGNAVPYAILQNALLANPLFSPYNADGTYHYDNLVNTPNVPRSLDEQQYNKTQYTSLFSTAYLDITLAKGLSFRSTFGINYNNSHPKNYQPQYYLGPNDQRAQSALLETRNESVSWVWSNYANYNKTFGDNSSFSATLGQEAQRSYGNGISVTAYNVPADADLQYVSATRSSGNAVRSSQYDSGLLSYFGRANYNFRDRYLLTGTLRFDQTSKFLGPVRTGTFPSVGAAWNISNEEFFKGLTAVPVLKLRASYGLVGNQNAAPNYGYASVARNNQIYVFNKTAAPGLAISQLNNPDLKWETAVTTDIGLDAEFFDSKLSFTADYFIRRTKDMIALLPVPDYVGQAPASANVGELRNRGLELALNYRNVLGKLQYNVGLNFTKIGNEITSLGGASPIASGNVLVQTGNTTLTDVGREVAYFYGLQAQGVFHTQAEIDAYKNAAGKLVQPGAKPGDVRYQDTNGDGQITSLDNTYLGSGTPSFTYGASVNLSYSNFDFKVLLYGVQGAEAVNAGAFSLLKSNNFVGAWTNFYASRMDRWTPSNPNSDQPRMTSNDTNGNDRFSSRYVENASYLRARNMELGYTLPKTLLTRFQINGFRVFASVDNVFTITKYTGYDPEISTASYYGNPLAFGVDYGNYPQARTYRLGFNVQF